MLQQQTKESAAGTMCSHAPPPTPHPLQQIGLILILDFQLEQRNLNIHVINFANGEETSERKRIYREKKD